MELGIIGHTTRGDEVIKILEMLGGKNCCYRLTGYNDKYFYYISYEYKYISNSYIGPDEIKGYEIFSLEDFLEKFPYKVGDKVTLDNKLCSIIWMCWECNNIYYQVQGEDLRFTKKVIANELKPYKEKKINQMSLTNEDPQIDPTIDYYEIMLNDFYDGLKKQAIENIMDTLYKTGITHEYLKDRGFNLPEGYHFTDENGNAVNATKILLVKNSPSYPKTYEECLDVLSMDYARHYNLRYFTYERGFYEYATTDKLCSLQDKLNILGKLIICRNAYWKIAGEHLELDKPWEPDWLNPNIDLYVIINSSYNEVYEAKYERGSGQRILVFPTIEMRDAFYNNFKFLIEQCKELL